MRWRQRNSFNLFGSQYFTSGTFFQLCENRWMCSKFSGLPNISQLPSDKPPFIHNCTVWLAQMPVCGLLIGSALSLWPESVYILYFCRARWWWKWHYHTQFRMVSSTQVKHIKEFTIQTKINQMFTESQLFQKMSYQEEYTRNVWHLCDPVEKKYLRIMWVKLNQQETPTCLLTTPCMI